MNQPAVFALLCAFALLLPGSAGAAGHSENWCADAVDFAMRTAEYRNYGRTQEYTANSIERDSHVFKAQYPDLSVEDMKQIADTVYASNWSHFGAAAAMSKTCPSRTETRPLALLSGREHSDEWCANAVDFAMGVAQNRELAFAEKMMKRSYDQNPAYYGKLFPELSKPDMVEITTAVYHRPWSRFGAAAAVSASCKLAMNQPVAPAAPH